MSKGTLTGLRLLSLLDGLLLAALVYASLGGRQDVVVVLGPTHGLLFLLLVASLGLIARRGQVGARFVVAVMIFGPLVSVPGLEVYRRRQRR